MYICFFFQAEDGIRDADVTGVQTCALPIYFHLPPSTRVISKATDPKKEAYSAFEGTTLDEHLRKTGVKRLFIGGVGTRYCGLNTGRDAVKRDYAVCLLIGGGPAGGPKPRDSRTGQ